MLSLKRHLWGALAALLILVPGSAPAQTIATSFEELSHILKTGQTVVVIDANGRETRGKMVQSTPTSLVLLEGTGLTARRSLTEETVSEVRRLDPRMNGALIGLGVGLGAGVAIISAMCADGPGCGPSAQVGMLTAGLGAAIGAGIDSLVNRDGRVVFRSPKKATRLMLSPFIGKDRQGLLLSVRLDGRR